MQFRIVIIILQLICLCYKIGEEKFEKCFQTYKNQQKFLGHISYHQKRLLLRDLVISICYLFFAFVFLCELYHCFTHNYER